MTKICAIGIHLDETQCMDNMRSIIHIIFVAFAVYITCYIKSDIMNKFVNIHGDDQVLIRCSESEPARW